MNTNDINIISKYIADLDYECSNCFNFNRGWVCCGQFAPYMYIYTTLLYDNEYEDFIEKHNVDWKQLISKKYLPDGVFVNITAKQALQILDDDLSIYEKLKKLDLIR